MADRLSLDSKAAIKAGMSYGQWKALHPHTAGTMPDFRQKENLVPCEYCGTPFEKKKRNQRFCSIYCSQRNAYEKRKQQQQRTLTKVCAECHKEFQTTNQSKIFCSGRCRDRQNSRKKYWRDKNELP